MTLPLVLAHATKVALLALLAGMVVRGKARQCWTFVIYVGAILVGNTLVSLWPERFFNWPFWLLKQRVYDVLKAAVALELAYRVLAAFPGAWRTGRRVLAVVLTVSTAAVLVSVPRASYANVLDWQPRVTTGAIWLLTATALVVVRYEIPIRDWQRAIMLGFAPYLLVFVTLMGLLKRFGWSFLPRYNVLDDSAYMVLVLFWAYSAWRVEQRVTVPLAEPLAAAAEESWKEPAGQPVGERFGEAVHADA